MAIKIHAIQTGLVRIKHAQRERQRGGMVRILADRTWTEWLPIYCWVIDHPEGPIVVDTGETARSLQPGYYPGWHPYYRSSVRMQLQPQDEVGPQLERLGLPPKEIKTVILTHFHTDHAGGLSHFPHSRIWVSGSDFRLAGSLGGKLLGYLPQYWPRWFDPQAIPFERQPVGPFEQSFQMTRAGDVRVIPTPGHTPAHVSVVVEAEDVFYLLAGDTSYTQKLMQAGVADGVSPEPRVTLSTLERIRLLAGDRPLVYLPTHDPDSTARLSSISTVQEAPAEKEKVYA